MPRKWKHRAKLPAKIRAAQAAEQLGSFLLAGAGACTITAAAASDAEGAKLATFSGNAYTGAVMKPPGWGRLVIDLAGVKVPNQHRPVLRQHDAEQIVGHTTAIKVDPKSGIKVEGTFSGEKQHTDKVTVPAKNGFEWQLSVGADPVRKEYLEDGKETTVNGQKVVGPLVISRETVLGEISFVPNGADGETSAVVNAQKGTDAMNPFAAALKSLMAELRAAGKVATYTDEAIDAMDAGAGRLALKKCMEDDSETEASDDEDDEDEEDDDEDDAPKKKAKGKKASAKAKSAASLPLKLARQAERIMTQARRDAAAEIQRHADIQARVNRHGVTSIELETGGKKKSVNLAAHAIAEGWTADQAELHALRAARPGPGVGIPGGLGYSTSTPQASEAVLEAALLHAARHQFKLADDSFYSEPTPDGKGTVRRVSESLQRETQRELKARYTDEVQQQAHTLFKGRLGLHQLLAACFAANGQQRGLDLRSESGIRSALQTWDHMEQGQAIRAEGASNMSISNILANVLNKFALQGYLFVEQAWREVFAIRSVNDFKPTKSINLLGDVMFKTLGPAGELSNADVADQAFSNQAQPYGRILTIPWTHLVNDDLGMLTGIPLKLGQGAGLALNDNVWSLWAAASRATTVNGIAAPNGDDGTAFWRTSTGTTKHKKYNANKTSGGGSALSTTSIATVRALFDNQIDPDGNPLGFDGTMPRLLHGPTLWQTVNQLLYGNVLITTALGSTSAAAVQSDKNVWGGTMKPVMSRYLENANYGNSTTAWFVLFDPAALPVAEVAFLDGVDTPAVLQASPDYQFDRLGISIRGTMPFGSNVQNFRGGVYSAGA